MVTSLFISSRLQERARPRRIGEMGLAPDCGRSCAVRQIENARRSAPHVCKGQMRAGDDRQEGLASARRRGCAYGADARPGEWQRKRVAGGRATDKRLERKALPRSRRGDLTMQQTLHAGRPSPQPAGYRVNLSRGERVGRVASEWLSRPADERYLSLTELHRAVKARADRSRARTLDSHEMRVEASRNNPERLALVLPGEPGPVAPTHWSIGQLASLFGAPAGYLRQLPAPIAGINLQYGLAQPGHISCHRHEGWKWVETARDFPYNHTYGLQRVFPTSEPLSEEDQARLDAVREE